MRLASLSAHRPAGLRTTCGVPKFVFKLAASYGTQKFKKAPRELMSVDENMRSLAFIFPAGHPVVLERVFTDTEMCRQLAG